MEIKKWFFDGHPQQYHVAALLLALMALGLTFTTALYAQTSGTTTTAPTTTACSYSYSDWSACQSNGTRSRSVTGVTPSGCVQASNPAVSESCTYTPPQCSYSYGNWSDCQTSGTQSRLLTATSPSGCLGTTAPVLSRSCTYTPPTTTATTNTTNTTTTTNTTNTTNTTTTSSPSGTNTTTATACAYSYSDWGTCQSDGKRSRSVTSITPSGCVQTSAPKISESCTYTNTTTTTTAAPEQCVYTYAGWGACQTNGKRTRALISKSPATCEEYTHPVLEQSCVYDTATTATTATSTSAPLATSAPLVSPTNTATGSTSETTTAVTPAFSFLNVSDGAVIQGTFEIKGSVPGAQSVEYYLVQSGSNTFKYIGSGARVSDTGWQLKFRSTEFPNGEFYLRAKIKNQYGEYGSGQRKITIANTEKLALGTTGANDGFVPLEMGSGEKTQILQKVTEAFNIPAAETTTGDTQNYNEQKKHILTYCEEHPEKCFLEQDSDKDGLNDIDEIRYGSNPNEADTDLDGFIDGDEVKSGFNPLKYSPGDQSDRIVFEDPKVSGETKKKNYVVDTVELQSDDAGKKKLRLTGKGLPNSFVTIYVYSDPIVLTVKTDSEGNWTYELDKDLEDGQHEAYVAITDNTGKITGKSEPIAFVKTAQAVTVIPTAQATVPEATLTVTQHRTERDLFFLVAIIIGALAVALAIIGLIKHKHAAHQKELLNL